jgi:DNA-directed RNA polymerase specialized sigma24 family protein
MTRAEANDFEAHRSFLAGLACRMLGSIAEAEDVVQDAYLRWAEADAATVAHPRAYLAQVVTRSCLRKAFEALKSRGVKFDTDVLRYPFGSVAVFQDPAGNRLQLRQPR